jgi:hypothetical protein
MVRNQHFDYIIKHEQSHSTEFDISHEFKLNPSIVLRLIKFIIFNPSSWIDFSPIQIKQKRLVYDANLMILYIISILYYFLNANIFSL